MDNAITCENLSVELKSFTLKDINLQIPRGTVVGLIGRNGAGKTTLIKALTDVYIPTEGRILYGDRDLQERPEQIKSKIGVVYDSYFYPVSMKAVKIAKLMANIYDDFDMDKFHRWMQYFGLDEKQKPVTYSKGMQMKFMFAVVLARDPEVLILDEPTAGLDPAARNDLINVLMTFMQDESKTILFSTHITSDLEKIADYLAMVEDGKLVFMEDKESLMDNYAIVALDKALIDHTQFEDLYRDKLIGIRENTFGYTGLTRDKAFFQEKPGVKMTKATIEDLLIFQNGSSQVEMPLSQMEV